jgi:hypothetical protein
LAEIEVEVKSHAGEAQGVRVPIYNVGSFEKEDKRDSMYTSLYYPHTKIQTEGLMKTALLLWDRVEYICPMEFVPDPYDDKVMAEAAELITEQHIPSAAEKEETHEVVKRLLSKRLPDCTSGSQVRVLLGSKSFGKHL